VRGQPEDRQQDAGQDEAEDEPEPAHRAGLVELAVPMRGPIRPFLLRLGPCVVVQGYCSAASLTQTYVLKP
jgi:hypothetical protein